MIQKIEPDIIHETYFFKDYYISPKSVKIITVHDLIHEKFPQFFPKNDQTIAYKKLAIKKADKIICISDNTRNDLLEIYNIDEKKVFTVHHGVDLGNKLDDDHFNKKKQNKTPFILYVGNRDGHKNFKILLNAFCQSKKIHDNFNLVLFGGGHLNKQELEIIRKSEIDINKIQVTDGEDEKLIQLYQRAKVFVITSLYEGFGMPVLEAMNNSCPVIASNKSSIPEVGSSAAQYFDPENLEELMEILHDILFNDSKLNEMINDGLSRSSQFTWEKSAHKTLKIYKSL